MLMVSPFFHQASPACNVGGLHAAGCCPLCRGWFVCVHVCTHMHLCVCCKLTSGCTAAVAAPCVGVHLDAGVVYSARLVGALYRLARICPLLTWTTTSIRVCCPQPWVCVSLLVPPPAFFATSACHCASLGVVRQLRGSCTGLPQRVGNHHCQNHFHRHRCRSRTVYRNRWRLLGLLLRLSCSPRRYARKDAHTHTGPPDYA